MVQTFPENGGRLGARFLPVMSFANNANATPVINHCSLRPPFSCVEGFDNR
jgi:hypothetical protein